MRVIRQFVVAVLLAAASWSSGQAQVRAVGSIVGVVSDATSLRPLSSAQVFIVGTGFGGLSNSSGRYTVANVPAGVHTLRVELIGYQPLQQQVTVTEGQATTTNLSLAQQALSLDEIVVTGTAGQARKREVGNSISQIKVEEVTQPVADVGALLTGRLAGSRVAVGSGNSGSGPDIRLRGNVSSALSNQPLIYIDGMRTQSEPISKQNGSQDPYSPLNDLNPDDIERIEVVKGPAATTLYGTEAAAGVIQIFTKRGGQGAPQWVAETQQGFAYFRPFGTKEVPYMWLDQVFQKGYRQRYSMSVKGGTDQLGYYVSGAFNDDKGAVETDWENQVSVRANTTFRPREDLLVQFNSSLAKTDLQSAQMGNSVTSIMMTAIRGPRNYMSGRRDEETLRLLLTGRDYLNTITRVVTGVVVNYAPGSDFTHRLTVGYDFAQDEHSQQQDVCWLCPIGIPSDFSDYVAGGEIQRAYATNSVWSIDYVGTLGFNLSDNVRNTLSFGAQSLKTEVENTLSVGRLFPGPGEYTLTSAALRQTLRQNKLNVISGGFFAQNMMAFSDKYFVTMGLRVDGNSAFGESLGFQVYPKVSGSYVISDEGFWPDKLGQVKLRGAYGLAGRAPGAFDKVRTWNPVGFGESGQAYYPQNLGNDNLGPERTAEYELGFDGGWLDGRFSADVTYFHQTTSDALFQVSRPASTGGWNAQLENVGRLENKGIEINTNTVVLNTRMLRWDLGLGLSTNHNKVLDLGGTAPFSVGNNGWVFEGMPMPVIYGYRVMNPDELADPIIPADRQFYGPSNPTHMFSASTTFGLPGGVQLTARGEYQGGAYISNNFETNALTRTVAHPKCWDAYRKVDPNWNPGPNFPGTNTTDGSTPQPAPPATRPQNMYAWEWAQCFGMKDPNYGISASDLFELRELTLAIPLSRLVPFATTWANRVDLTISDQNAWFYTPHISTGHPEQSSGGRAPSSSGEYRHDLVRSIQETLPPRSQFTVSLRAVF